MPLTFNDGGSTKRIITKLRQMQRDGTLRNMATLKVKDAGGTLRTIATFTSPLTASLSTTYLYQSSTAQAITTGYVTATPVGGTAPYSYSWVKTGTATINSPASAVTSFSETGMLRGDVRDTSATVTVSDSAGQTVTATLTVEIERLSAGGFA